MKKTIYRLAAIVAGVILSSCSMLDREPTIITKYYTNADEVKSGLAAVYGVLGRSELYGNVFSLTIANSDDLIYPNRDIVIRPDYYNHSAGEINNFQAWSALYEGVKNANEFLVAMKDSKLDPNKVFYTEAKFMRAYYQFVIAQSWGDVPLRTKPTLVPTDTELAATSQSDILKWCVAEMEDCVTALTEDQTKITPSRITRSTVEGILARVYLFMAGETVKNVDKTAMLTKAAYWSNEVIARNNHRLNPDYTKVFVNMISNKYDTENYESMWEVEFLGDRSTDRFWTNGRIGDNIGLQCSGDDTNYAEWNCNFAYGLYNASLKLWYLYWNTDRTAEEDAKTTVTDTRMGWNIPVYNYTGNKAKGYRGGYDKTPYSQGSTVDSFNDITAAAGIRNAGKWRRETIYEGNIGGKQNFTKVNFPLLRYSDVLLMWAEATNELNGPTQAAYDVVKQVRDRATIATKPFSDYSGDKTIFRDFIRNERARELAFEGIRKFDLIRWGTYVAEVRLTGGYADDPRFGIGATDRRALNVKSIAASIQPKHIYMPIPTGELSQNTLMKQNPLW